MNLDDVPMCCSMMELGCFPTDEGHLDELDIKFFELEFSGGSVYSMIATTDEKQTKAAEFLKRCGFSIVGKYMGNHRMEVKLWFRAKSTLATLRRQYRQNDPNAKKKGKEDADEE